MFSVVGVSHYVHGGGGVSIQGPGLAPLYRVPALPPPVCTEPLAPVQSPTPQTCSNLFNLDLTVQGPLPPDIVKLVHYVVLLLASGQLVFNLNAFLFPM